MFTSAFNQDSLFGSVSTSLLSLHLSIYIPHRAFSVSHFFLVALVSFLIVTIAFLSFYHYGSPPCRHPGTRVLVFPRSPSLKQRLSLQQISRSTVFSFLLSRILLHFSCMDLFLLFSIICIPGKHCLRPPAFLQ